jgi:hypothetical protein
VRGEGGLSSLDSARHVTKLPSLLHIDRVSSGSEKMPSLWHNGLASWAGVEIAWWKNRSMDPSAPCRAHSRHWASPTGGAPTDKT